MNIWILQTGEPLHIDAGNPRPMRAMNLANSLVDAGHNVTLWTTAFCHQEKRHRSHIYQQVIVSPQLKLRLIPSPGYIRNIGLGRLWDHAVLAWNLREQLKLETSPPDAAFIGYPPIEAAFVMVCWLVARGTACILDIKDQWPTLFVDALPKALQPLGRVLFFPYYYLAKRAMRNATGLSAMAESFLAWAIDFSGRRRTDMDRVVPLTAPTGQVKSMEMEAARQWWDKNGVVADGRMRVFFVGSHSPAFDIEPICMAAKHFSLPDNPCEFVICGHGEYSADWRSRLGALPNVHFPGWVDRAQIETLAERSQAALTPYRNVDNFTKNLPNKVIDAFSLGLPVLSPLQGEVASLISNHGVGLRYGTDSERSLVQCIEKLIDNPTLRQQISKNALNLYQEQFSFEQVYGGLVKHLEALGLKKRTGA